MKNTFEQQIYEIFGTTDPKELRRLSKDAEQYQQLAQKEALRHAAGRKPAFSLPQIIQMAAMQQQGKSIAEIARTFQVSRQTVYNQIARAHCFSTDPDVKTRMCFLYRDQLCTTIDIDFRHEKIAIQNYTKKIPLRAFGVVEHPTWLKPDSSDTSVIVRSAVLLQGRLRSPYVLPRSPDGKLL